MVQRVQPQRRLVLGIARTFYTSPLYCFDTPLRHHRYTYNRRITTCASSCMSFTTPLSEGMSLEPDQLFRLRSEDGVITVVGFGSLLSVSTAPLVLSSCYTTTVLRFKVDSSPQERSARYTFPTLANFRTGIVHDYRRVFAHSAPIFFIRGMCTTDSV